jgi:hypothetical protein
VRAEVRGGTSRWGRKPPGSRRFGTACQAAREAYRPLDRQAPFVLPPREIRASLFEQGRLRSDAKDRGRSGTGSAAEKSGSVRSKTYAVHAHFSEYAVRKEEGVRFGAAELEELHRASRARYELMHRESKASRNDLVIKPRDGIEDALPKLGHARRIKLFAFMKKSLMAVLTS